MVFDTVKQANPTHLELRHTEVGDHLDRMIGQSDGRSSGKRLISLNDDVSMGRLGCRLGQWNVASKEESE